MAPVSVAVEPAAGAKVTVEALALNTPVEEMTMLPVMVMDEVLALKAPPLKTTVLILTAELRAVNVPLSISKLLAVTALFAVSRVPPTTVSLPFVVSGPLRV